MIINFLLLPVTMLLFCLIFFGVILGVCAAAMNKKIGINESRWRMSGWCGLKPVILLIIMVEICFFGILAAIAAVFMTALVIVPAYIV